MNKIIKNSRKIIIIVLLLLFCRCSVSNKEEPEWPEKVRVLLDNTDTLKYDNGSRLPLYLWPAIDPGVFSEAEAEILVSDLDKRGIGIVSSWSMEDTLAIFKKILPIARAQKRLGMRININATDLLYSFYNEEESTAHTGETGKRFFDNSFGEKKMGCPFTLDSRKEEIRKRVDTFVRRYKDEGLRVDFIFADWEVDGPLEVNRAYEASGKCTICKSYLGNNFTFTEFQKRMREMRSFLLHYTLTEPLLNAFPDALTGNYAVYPNDGYRYWYDYFEYYVDDQPYKAEQHAKYRQWYNDFPLTGFTFAMPVVYTWAGIFSWYDFDNRDYRWFYNMLLNASNAGKSTPSSIPIISFVHWHTIFEGNEASNPIAQMSKEAYQELLWHMLLRGTDTFFMWSEKEDYPEEVRLVHEVYAKAQKYGNFLEHGIPMTFDVPDKPGTVISGLILGDSALVRRTDFTASHDDVKVLAGTRLITVEYTPGICKTVSLK